MLKKSARTSGNLTGMLRKSGPGLKVAVFFLSVLLFGSLLVFVLERNRNAGFSSFFDSLWWAIVTVSTVGYGDRVPQSVAGKAVAVGTMFLGVAMMGVITGRIASFLMERQMKEEKGLLSFRSMKGHFIICGWKQEMNNVLQAILTSNPGLTPSGVVLINKAPEEEVNAVRSDPRFKEIKTVYGDFIEERDLMRAGIRKAARVLVLADYYTPGNLQQLDSKTVMAVMTIKNLNRRAYVCAELLDTTFAKYLQLSHCEEILFSRDFSRAMLASASSGTGLTHVIRDLLVKEEGGWIETRKVPESFVGKTFHELREHYYGTIGAQLIGLLENTGNINDRKREALIEAQKNPDISKLVPELKSIKTLAANKPVINPARDYIVDRYARAIVVRGPDTTSVGAVS
jgi:voltage-gated potassium channel